MYCVWEQYKYVVRGKDGNLVQRTPDLAGGAIRIASNRSAHLHFTLPYYDSGFVLAVQMPKEPVDPTVCVGGGWVGVGGVAYTHTGPFRPLPLPLIAMAGGSNRNKKIK